MACLQGNSNRQCETGAKVRNSSGAQTKEFEHDYLNLKYLLHCYFSIKICKDLGQLSISGGRRPSLTAHIIR
uniref:Uncharacterized protein n=1 Tax=Romanomermis culicivorax TaxID=13658 RepID=A0A915J1T6_ROMCU